MPGRRILTATASPSGVFALWTCAMEAAAIAVSSNESNSSLILPFSSVSIVALAATPLNAGRLSCSVVRSLARVSPTRSGRTESACPSLTKAGPSAVIASVSRSPGRRRRYSDLRGASRTIRSRIGTIFGRPARSSGNSASWRANTRATVIIRRKWRRPANMVQIRQPECSQTIPPDIGVCVTLPKPASRISVASCSGSGNFRILSAR